MWLNWPPPALDLIGQISFLCCICLYPNLENMAVGGRWGCPPISLNNHSHLCAANHICSNYNTYFLTNWCSNQSSCMFSLSELHSSSSHEAPHHFYRQTTPSHVTCELFTYTYFLPTCSPKRSFNFSGFSGKKSLPTQSRGCPRTWGRLELLFSTPCIAKSSMMQSLDHLLFPTICHHVFICNSVGRRRFDRYSRSRSYGSRRNESVPKPSHWGFGNVFVPSSLHVIITFIFYPIMKHKYVWCKRIRYIFLHIKMSKILLSVFSF